MIYKGGTFMSHVFVVNFGNVNGVQRFRVHGTMPELIEIIKETTLMGHVFVTKPIIEHVRKNQFTVWIELVVPLESMALQNHG